MVYLLSVGERIDALSVSNLLAAWNEVGLAADQSEAFDILRRLVLDKANDGAFFSKGSATALVNIIKACNEMHFTDSEFIECVLTGLQNHFEEL